MNCGVDAGAGFGARVRRMVGAGTGAEGETGFTVGAAACPRGTVSVRLGLSDTSGVLRGARGLSLMVFFAAEDARAGFATGIRFSVAVSVFLNFNGSLTPPLLSLGVFSLMFKESFSAVFSQVAYRKSP